MIPRRLLVDTNVWGAELDPTTAPLRHRYARQLVGVAPAIAAQTVVELRYGGLASGRLGAAADGGDRAAHPPGHGDPRRRPRPVDHARLRTACRRAGQPLHDRTHAADLWVAASAVAHQFPLVSDDTVFANVPGLTVVIEPA